MSDLEKTWADVKAAQSAALAAKDAQIAALREALKPFADAARAIDDNGLGGDDNHAAYSGMLAPLYGDLRRALLTMHWNGSESDRGPSGEPLDPVVHRE
jgi:hypothetical protein